MRQPDSATWTKKLWVEMLKVVGRCHDNLIVLERSELDALFLTVLTEACQATAVALFLPVPGGDLELELSLGPLPTAAVPPALRLTRSEQQELLGEPERGEQIKAIQLYLRSVWELDSVLAFPLVQDQAVSGLVFVFSAAGGQAEGDRRAWALSLGEQFPLLIEAAALFNRMLQRSMMDDLTGLFNHRYLNERLAQEISRASRHGQPLSILFCSVDDWPILQRQNGRFWAQNAVNEIATLFRTGDAPTPGLFSFRGSDVPVHYGSGDFIVLLPETPKKGAQLKAEDLRKAVSTLELEGPEPGKSVRVTVSIGVATFPHDATVAAGLLNEADLALHRARELGQDRVFAF